MPGGNKGWLAGFHTQLEWTVMLTDWRVGCKEKMTGFEFMRRTRPERAEGSPVLVAAARAGTALDRVCRDGNRPIAPFVDGDRPLSPVLTVAVISRF